ncbi:MAG: DNA mismatch repair protein MutT [Chloroflexi bacterium HGW-Chloroflexi-6]|nr:MAG: DNA mismatch repair protein MutT [Chloroflexi bacterium HGW-Chloroflexi-6]
MRAPRPTARAIIIQGDKIALLERTRQGRHYFVFPGGGIDPGETPAEAAVREALEETGLEIELERLVAEVQFHGSPQYYFLSHPTGGELGTGTGPEMIAPPSLIDGTYDPCWVSLTEIPNLPVLPGSIAALAACHPLWPESPLSFEE